MIGGGVAVSMNVEDGAVEAPLSKRVGKAAQFDIRVVVDTKNDFVPEVESCVDGLKHVFIEECEGIRGGRAGNTRCGEVLGPDRAAPVW